MDTISLISCIVLFIVSLMIMMAALFRKTSNFVFCGGGNYFVLHGEVWARCNTLSLDNSMRSLRRGPPRRSEDTVVEGSDNGVLCLSRLGSVYLWSPTGSGISKQLPPSPVGSRIGYRAGVGRHPLSGDQRVVMICGGEIRSEMDGALFNVFTGETRAWVHSSRTNCWRSVPFSLDLEHVRLGWTSLNWSPLVNGCLHWSLVFKSRTQESTSFQFAIVSFDLSTDAFRLVAPPCQMPAPTTLCDSVSKLHGCLSIVSYNRRQNFIHVWVMKQYGVSTSWTSHLALNMTCVDCIVPLQLSNLTLADSGFLMISACERGLFCYNLKTGALQHFSAVDGFVGEHSSSFFPDLFDFLKSILGDGRQGHFIFYP